MWRLGLYIGLLIFPHDPGQPCDAEIRIVETGQNATIEAACAAPVAVDAAHDLRYELLVDRIGASGTSRSKQGGAFIPGTASADTLSRMRVSFSPGDALNVQLLIYDGDQLVSSKEFHRERE